MKTQKFLSELAHGDLFSLTSDVISSKSVYVALGDVVKPSKMKQRICRNYATSQFVFVENMLVYPLEQQQVLFNL